MFTDRRENLFDSIKELKKIHDPKYVGPGTWVCFHLVGKMIDEAGQKGSDLRKYIILLTDHISERFPCKECRKHFKEMMIINSPRNVRIGDFFNYTYRIHSMVNEQINKRNPSLDNVKMWYNDLREHKDVVTEVSPPFMNKKIGPGFWWLIHSTSIHNRELFSFILNVTIKTYPCKICRMNIENFLGDKLEKVEKEEYPYLAWDMHNFINTLTDKTTLDYKNVETFYKLDDGCSSDCVNGKRDNHVNFRVLHF